MRPDIAKRRAKYEGKTEAQKVFKNSMLLTERPAGMSFATYKRGLKLQAKAIKMLFPKQVDQLLSRAMQPKQKSAHHQQMVLNARFIKYGTDITQESKDNKKIALLPKSWVSRQFDKVRNIFNNK